MERVYVSETIAERLINEGDIFLYRANSIIGWTIATYTGGPYSHASIATWRGVPHFSSLEVAEQREFRNGRIVSFESQVDDYSGYIDVYRPALKIETHVFNNNGKNNGSAFGYITKIWTPEVARKVTDDIRRAAGTRYGWKLIWKMFLHYAPGLRLFFRSNTDDSEEQKLNVCSTLIAAFMKRHYTDPTPNLSTTQTTPNDLSRSAVLNYLFSIRKDEKDKSK